MKKLTPFHGLAGVLLLTAIATGLHGHWTNRWDEPFDLLQAAEKLDAVPTECGDWKMEASSDLDKGTLRMLQCAGYISRTYVNTATQASVNVAILVGPPGPISVHTPDICYSSQAYKITDKRKPKKISGRDRPDERFWAMTFQPKAIGSRPLRVYYAWSDGGTWVAQKDGRYAFAGRTHLFKIQLAAKLPYDTGKNAEDPCEEFLQAFLPQLDDVLFQ